MKFGTLFREAADSCGIPFLDASLIVEPSPIDGGHFGAEAHARLNNAIAEKILSL